jgi:hypothetical protein
MDVNDFSIELAKNIEAEALNKAIPPKLYYRLRRFLKMNRSTQLDTAKLKQNVQHALHQKAEEIKLLKELKKNEFMASVYDSGSVKMDFGSGIPEQVKKAAMTWAKKKGLKPVEASLNKSGVSTSSVLFASGTSDLGLYMKCVKWEIGE